jgi:hypothetical protein
MRRRFSKMCRRFSSAFERVTMGSFAAAHVLTHRDSWSFSYTKEWSIGIYAGDSPLDIAPSPNVRNPVLTPSDVTDVEASAVADPFIIRRNGEWYMFFEVIRRDTDRGDIGLATSHDGFAWQYERTVLSEPFHLSYPLVCEWNGEVYMIPETSWTDSIRLYRATRFPYEWAYCQTLMRLKGVCDATPFVHENLWWLFTSVPSHDVLRLFYSNTLTGPWLEHPRSPIVKANRRIARPGGRVLVFDGRIIRLAQDAYPTYGTALRAFEILGLSTTAYQERQVVPSPLLRATGIGWNRGGMHHADLQQMDGDYWLGAVDGFARHLALRIHF